MANTTYAEVYDAFLASITDDMYISWTKEDTYADLFPLLKSAIVRFFMPREDLRSVGPTEDGEPCFTCELSYDTINLLVLLMTREWLARQMNTVRIVQTQLTGSDAKAINTKQQAEAVKTAQEANATAIARAYHDYEYQTFDEESKQTRVSDLDLSSGSTSNMKTRGRYRDR